MHLVMALARPYLVALSELIVTELVSPKSHSSPETAEHLVESVHTDANGRGHNLDVFTSLAASIFKQRVPHQPPNEETETQSFAPFAI